MIENLSVLCLDCHSIVTGDEGLGRRYSSGEVIHYKKDWETQCASGKSNKEVGEEEEDEPSESHYEDSILEGDSHFVVDYELQEDDDISIWASSDDPIHLIIMRKKDYKRWLKTGEVASYEEFHENQFEIDTWFTVPEDGHYSIVLINDSNEDVEIQLDISVWSA